MAFVIEPFAITLGDILELELSPAKPSAASRSASSKYPLVLKVFVNDVVAASALVAFVSTAVSAVVVAYPEMLAPAGIVTVPVNVGFAIGALSATFVKVAYVAVASSEDSFEAIELVNVVIPL